ncbi:unnamed protein product [Closterium sp. NIES-65]|nr:unnamed protein product [Closterium sp. NIES-65]
MRIASCFWPLHASRRPGRRPRNAQCGHPAGHIATIRHRDALTRRSARRASLATAEARVPMHSRLLASPLVLSCLLPIFPHSLACRVIPGQSLDYSPLVTLSLLSIPLAHPLSYTLIPSPSLSLTPSRTHSSPLIPSHTLPFPLIPSHSLSLPLIPSHSLSFPLIPSHPLSFTLIHSHTLSSLLIPSHSLSYTLNHSHPLS